MYELDDHPDIKSVMRTGYLKQYQKRSFCCPACGAELDSESTIYSLSVHGDEITIGCNECVQIRTVAELYE